MNTLGDGDEDDNVQITFKVRKLNSLLSEPFTANLQKNIYVV